MHEESEATWRRLQKAVADGQLVVVREVLGAKNLDVNFHNEGPVGDPILLTAALRSAEIVACLLDAGANPDIQSPAGITALTLACGGTGEARPDSALALIQRGADVNLAVHGFTPLMYAARTGQVELVEVLVAKGAELNATTTDGTGLTPLLFAAACRQEEVARLLLAAGAEAGATSSIGFTALIYAAQQGLPGLAADLLEQVAPSAVTGLVDARNDEGWTALHMAIAKGRLGIAKLLLQHGASTELTSLQGTALHGASLNGDEAGVELLLRFGANPNHRIEVAEFPTKEATPLTFALLAGKDEVCRLLLAYGGDSDLALGKEPEVGLSFEDRRQFLKSTRKRLDVLVQHFPGLERAALPGIDSDFISAVRSCMEACDRGDLPPRAQVEESLSKTPAGRLLDSMELTRPVTRFYLALVYPALGRLRSRGGTAECDPVQSQERGAGGSQDLDALKQAVERDDEDAIIDCVEAGAEFLQVRKTASAGGGTLLSWAVNKGYQRLAKVLIDHGADVNDAGTPGHIMAVPPLYFALGRGQRSLVEILLAAGADPDARDPSGCMSMVDVAKAVATPEIHALLLSHSKERDSQGEEPAAAAAERDESELPPKSVQLTSNGGEVNRRGAGIQPEKKISVATPNPPPRDGPREEETLRPSLFANDPRMPKERAYGTLGPHAFALWEGLSDEESADWVTDKGRGIVNGAEYPGSMSRCHEGHLAALFKAARHYSTHDPDDEFARVLFKILVAESAFRNKMSFRLDGPLAEAGAILEAMRKRGVAVENLDPINYFERRWPRDASKLSQSESPGLAASGVASGPSLPEAKLSTSGTGKTKNRTIAIVGTVVALAVVAYLAARSTSAEDAIPKRAEHTAASSLEAKAVAVAPKEQPRPDAPGESRPPVPPAERSLGPEVAEVTASSTMPDWKRFSFGVRQLLDGKLATTWQPAPSPEGGVGQWVTFRFHSAMTVTGIQLWNGFQVKDGLGDEFLLNSRASGALLTCEDGYDQRVERITINPDLRGEQRIPVPAMRCRSLRFTVTGVRPGTRWKDLAISELGPLGY